jgi:tetratricopeptide (TPR) repeat protein
MKITAKHIVFSAVAIFIVSFLCPLSYAQEKPVQIAGDSGAGSEKNSIRRMYNDAKLSYRELKIKIKNIEEQKRIENIQKETKNYYDLAKTLEKRGEYLKAACCYQKILSLSEHDRELKAFIRKKNKELRELADKKRDTVQKKIWNKKKKLKTTGSQYDAATEKRRKSQSTARVELFDRLEKRLNELEK